MQTGPGSRTAAMLCAATLALGGCETTQPAAQTRAAAPGGAPTSFEGVCAALLPDSRYEELRAALGDGVVLDDEGNLYINLDTARALEPILGRTVDDLVVGLEVRSDGDGPRSEWTLHGVGIGDTAAALERANGRPFTLTEDGVDWGGGALDGDACTYAVSFGADAEGFEWSRSDDPAVRARAPKVTGFSMRWRRDGYTIPKPSLPQPAPVAARRSLKAVCDVIRENMTPDELRAAFGAGNVRNVDDAALPLSVTVYPDDPQRAFQVDFGGEEGSWRIYTVIVDNPATTWALPNGLGMGDRLDAIEQFAGGPFQASRYNNAESGGPAWDHGREGNLGACSYHVRLGHDRALVDRDQVRSDDPEFRSWRPRVTGFRLDWRWF